MGCRSDYLEPNENEKHTRSTAQLIIYVLETQGKGAQVDEKLKKAAQNVYGDVANSDALTSRLCQMVGKMKKKELDTIVYDGRNAQARELAAWWERHQVADAARIEREKKQAQEKTQQQSDEKLAQAALKKLSAEEQQALKRVMKR